MEKRHILLCLLGVSLLHLFTTVFTQTCEKKLLRKLGLTRYISACWYLCNSFIPRIGYEADGTPCTKRFRPGACMNGNCVTYVPPDPTLEEPSGRNKDGGRRGMKNDDSSRKQVGVSKSQSMKKKTPSAKITTRKTENILARTSVKPKSR